MLDYILETCFCGDIKVTPFSRPSNVSLSLTEYIYDGTEKNPTLIVKDAKGNTLVEGTDYTVSVPAGRTEVGTYAYVVDFMGNYIGTTTVDFVIKEEEPVHTHSYSANYGYDDTEHYTECECGAKNEVAAHVFEWATEKIATEFEEGSKYEKCEICGYRRASVVVEKLPHTHSYSTSWYSDDDNHWKECACGENDELAVHTFDEGIVTKEATESEEGTKTYTCTICSATKLETIPKLSAVPGTSTKPSADPGVSPSTKPSTDPSADPGVSPSTKPSTDPSADPGVSPSTKPSADPSADPGVSPSTKPSADPGTSADPSVSPSTKPSAEPSTSVKPSVNPSTKPSQAPVVTLKNQKITTAKMKAVKASVLSKKAVKVKLNAKTDGNGKLTYKVTKYPKKMNKFIKVSKKGVVTFKKNAKKGTYKITITADAKGEYQKTTKVVSIKVK